MTNRRRFFVVAIAGALVTSCTPESLETTEFNAYFYYPDTNREEYLGVVRGISACQSAAAARARSLNMTASTRWSYICCKQTRTSSCASKHK